MYKTPEKEKDERWEILNTYKTSHYQNYKILLKQGYLNIAHFSFQQLKLNVTIELRYLTEKRYLSALEWKG